MTDVLIVLCTCPDDAAEGIAKALVGERLAACVNVAGPLRSIFCWEGRINDESEALLIAKTTSKGYPRLERRLLALHPYDVPEVLALPVSLPTAVWQAVV